MPLAFVADNQGFMVFAIYAALVLVLAVILKKRAASKRNAATKALLAGETPAGELTPAIEGQGMAELTV